MLRVLSLAIAIILVAAAAQANFSIIQTYSVATSYSGPYQGDPSFSVSAITPSIVCEQSGTLYTPAFIQCSAYNTTASGTSQFYLGLEYVWTTNDPSADTFTLPVIGTKSAATQFGPEFTTVFRSAGTWTITLQVRACTNGRPTTRYAGGGGSCKNNAFTVATTTKTVTVAAFSSIVAHTYYFNTGGSDGNPCSLSQPCQTLSHLASLEGSNTQFYLDCGQTFNGSAGIGLTGSSNVSHLRIAPGGADCPGANPIVNMSSGSNFGLEIAQNGSGGVKSDYVVSSTTFTNSGSATGASLIEIAGNNTGGGSLNEVYLDNVEALDTLDLSGMTPINVAEDQTSVASVYQGVVLWNVTSETPLTAATTETGIIGGTHAWFSIVGGFVQGSGAFDHVRAHHVYMHCGGHCMTRWLNTGPSCSGGGCTVTRDSCIKTSYDQADGDGSASTSSYWLLSENYCEGVADLGGPGNNTNDPTVSTIDQYISQQNVFFEISGGVFPATGQNIAVRDNWACLTGTNAISVPVGQLFNGSPDSAAEDSYLISNIYRNLSYNNATSPAINYDANSPDTWTNAQSVFDNLLESASSGGILNDVPITNFNSVSSIVDYNTYYAPNNSGNFLQNANSGISLATWQGDGLDVHGANANPGWSSPSTCGFGSWPYN